MKLTAKHFIALWAASFLTPISLPAGTSAQTNAPAASIDTESPQKFWAFRPIRPTPVPPVQESGWLKNPIDNFIWVKLAENNLRPVAAADRRTLIRRATFDLTGLPPTPEEIDGFVKDSSAEAFARVVDRLLASAQYGERWGRHWLDVARYADSNGLDENVAHGNAWRYRDYVVSSFNRDKPFDEFILEQLAGDLLPQTDPAIRHERLIATGFLSLGPKVLAEPDPQKMEMDIIDEQIDTLGRAFMGLTLGCARCHDHKFDPIPTEDYYSLAGIFKSTKTMDDYKIVARWHENVIASPPQLQAKETYDKNVAQQKTGLTNWINQVNAGLLAEARQRLVDYLAAALQIGAKAGTNQIERSAAEAGLNVGFLKQWHSYLAKNTAETNSLFYGVLADAGSTNGVAIVPLAFEKSDYSTPRELATLYDGLFREAEQAVQGCTSNSLASAKIDSARKVLLDPKGPFALPAKIESFYLGDVAVELKKRREDLTRLEEQSPELPASMGVEEGQVTSKIPVHIRGSHLTLGKEVSKQFPRILSPQAPANINDRESGRLQLAQWLVSKDHPLTSRVIVNRIWRWHFGQGLVPTVDNFGKLGERPWNQPLLDWLATHFIESGWSMKAMHRLIMLSSTYSMSSSPDPEGLRIDPENRLLWRMNVRRLEAECIRDALLSVSGALDLSMGGKALALKNREFVFNHTSKDATRYEGFRRSLYQPIIRNHLYDLFELFDFPDPAVETGDRVATTIAPQALFMMNSEMVLDAAARLAATLLRESNASDAERVQKVYTTAYGRPANPGEVTRGMKFVEHRAAASSSSNEESAKQRQRVWQEFSQAILASNEFVYLR